jgi:hypothetical protein
MITSVYTDLKNAAEANRLLFTIQKHIIIEVDNFSNPKKNFVCLYNINYQDDSFIKALDICFKSFFVFNLKFTQQSTKSTLKY